MAAQLNLEVQVDASLCADGVCPACGRKELYGLTPVRPHLSVSGFLELIPQSRSWFYQVLDLKAKGEVFTNMPSIHKVGARSIIFGSEALQYLNGPILKYVTTEE